MRSEAGGVMRAGFLTADLTLRRELSVGRGSTDTLRSGALPKIYAVDAWDGKDGQVSVLTVHGRE